MDYLCGNWKRQSTTTGFVSCFYLRIFKVMLIVILTEVHDKAAPSDNNYDLILKVQEMLEALSNEWVAFQQCLIDSDAMLKKSKEKFKTGLLHSAEDLKKSVGSLQDDLNIKGAFSAKIPVDEVTSFYYCWAPCLFCNQNILRTQLFFSLVLSLLTCQTA